MAWKIYIKEKIWPFLAGMGSALVMVLAFFIPSLQDQYDRYQSRKVIGQYESLGNDFFEEEKYDMAEQAYQKAFELSDNKRLDLEIKRLQAKINRINIDPKWGTAPPEDLEEIDFQYVLHLQKGKENEKARVGTLNSYGIFLAATHQPQKSEQVFQEAIKTDSADVRAYINLGNLYDQQGKKQAAVKYYQRAIILDTENARAHYNLGLLYQEQGLLIEAHRQFSEAFKADSADKDIREQYSLSVGDTVR